MKNSFRSVRMAGLMCLAISGLGSHLQAALVTFETVLVGDAGNADASAANTSHGKSGAYGYGGVDYDYRIGTYEVTINQYATFLNTVATSYNSSYAISSLWVPQMEDGDIRGIARTFGPTGYVYTVSGNGERPVGGVSWFGAARFTNWVSNGATVGASTETGAYNLNGAYTGMFTKEVGATVWLPSEDEWYKAAYYDPTMNNGVGGYHLYANQSDSMTSHDLNVPGAANYAYTDPINPTSPGGTLYPLSGNLLTVVGEYDTPSYYGTYDQTGNIQELTDGVSGTSRVRRGGFARSKIGSIDASVRSASSPESYSAAFGFRIAAAAIPEPSVPGLLALGSVAIALTRRRGKSVSGI